MTTLSPTELHLTNSKPTSGVAIASLVCSLMGLLIPGLGLIGLVLGIIALRHIRKHGSRDGRGLAIAGVVIGTITLIIGVALGAGVLLPALREARQAARATMTQSNLKQISIGMAAYARDNKGYLPEVASGWQQRLSKYGLNGPTLESARAAETWTGPSLLYVSLPTALPDVQDPSSVVIVYEDPAIDPCSLVPVAFLDGSVRIISEHELATKIKAQTATQTDTDVVKPDSGTDSADISKTE